MKFKQTLIASMLVLATGCGQSLSESETKKIIGSDNRVKTNLGSGYLLVDGTETCAAWVKENNLIITAAHCYQGEDYKYEYAEIGEEAVTLMNHKFLGSDILSFSSKESLKPLELSRVYDNKISLRAIDFDSLEEFSSIGDIIKRKSGLLTYSLDTISGNSGAPILQDGKVIGTHIGYSKKLEKNIGVPLDSFQKLTSEIDSLDLDGECYRYNPLCRGASSSTKKTVNVCGVSFTVSALLYWACSASAASIPISCTAGAAATGGTSCAISISAAAGTCSVSVATLTAAAIKCIDTL